MEPLDKRLYNYSMGADIGISSDSPISLEIAKKWVRVTHDLEDDLIQLILDASIAHVEGITSYFFGERTVSEYFNGFPQNGTSLMLSKFPVVSITSLTYGESTIELDDLSIDVKTRPVFILPVDDEWPDTGEERPIVKVAYVAGHSDVDNIPNDLKLATLRVFADNYDNRADFHQRFRSASEVLFDKYRLRVFQSTQ